MKKNTPSKVVHLLKLVTAVVKKVKSPDRAQALQKCINEVCTRLEWPIGHAYFPAEDNPTRLDSSKLWFFDKPDQYKDFRDITETTSCDIDVDLPGRVLKTKKPAWIPDVTKDTNFPRANRAENIGVKAAFAFPVIADSEVIAVLEFFHPLAIEPDEQILAVMEDIGNQVGRVIKKIQCTAQCRNVKQMQQTVASRKFQPKNLIRPEELDFHRERIEAIWEQVFRLKANVYYIKLISEFPFYLFELGKRTLFWILVKDSMIESSITLIYKIWIDNDDRTLTLKRFKKEIVCRFKNEEDKKQFIGDWDIQLGKIGPNIEDRIRDLRNNTVHFNLNRALNIDVSDEDIKKLDVFLKEMDELTENIESLFFVLNLGHSHMYETTNLYDRPDIEHPSDIGTLLDTIAKESPVMHMPENYPKLWPEYRKLLDDDSKIEIFNKYRKKFQLPIVK